MTVSLAGVIHGRHIELESEPGIPDGAAVTVRIEAEDMSLEERRRRVQTLCGAWSGDDSLEAIFEEIDSERRVRHLREVDLKYLRFVEKIEKCDRGRVQ